MRGRKGGGGEEGRRPGSRWVPAPEPPPDCASVGLLALGPPSLPASLELLASVAGEHCRGGAWGAGAWRSQGGGGARRSSVEVGRLPGEGVAAPLARPVAGQSCGLWRAQSTRDGWPRCGPGRPGPGRGAQPEHRTRLSWGVQEEGGGGGKGAGPRAMSGEVSPSLTYTSTP